MATIITKFLKMTVEDSQELILLFKIPIGTWENFFEIFRQLGDAPSKRLASPGQGRSDSIKNSHFHDPLWVFTSVKHGRPTEQ
jgi:hypothetical protein